MAIQFYLTDAGRTAILNAENLGFQLTLSEIAVGTAKYDPATQLSNTTLVNEIERYVLNGGSVEPVTHTIRFITNIEPTVSADGFEIGLYTDSNVLFAIASTESNVPLIRLVENLVSIVTFGMIVSNLDISNLVISNDPNTPISIALMNEHLAHSNPHPQYGLLSKQQEIEQNVSDLIIWGNLKDLEIAANKQAQEDGDANLQQQLSDLSQQFQQQISNIVTNIANTYPKTRMAGVLNTNAEQALHTVNKPAGTNINFLDLRFAIVVSHEAKAINQTYVKRYADKFEVFLNVDDRLSGSLNSRNVNYAVIETSAIGQNSGNGDYLYSGNQIAVPILAGESKAFLIVGAGGGGGSSRYVDLVANSSPETLSGSDGQDSYISIQNTTIKFTSGGGKGGVGGVRDNQTLQYINGTAGAGGQWQLDGEPTSATRTNGTAGNATGENHTGASTDSNGRGAGGNGADGYEVITEGFGGGAGEGARLTIVYTNDTQDIQYALLYVGKGGIGERSLNTYDEDGVLVEPATENYVVGENGANGFIRVSSAV
ncbi:MAG: phage tail protein [Proteobacteria bacterium]|nr:phage tail protein [Pseudomonadota bacterium]MDA1254936.1 phage tail protein [Pseudomonadota bacterium]